MKERIHGIDEIRGLSIILMVLYHLAYNVTEVWGFDLPLFSSPLMYFLRDVFAGGFIFISGVSCRFSRNNRRRGLICLFAAVLITIATAVFMPSQLIIFGILHFLGVSILLYSYLEPYVYELSGKYTPYILLLLFFLTSNINRGYIGIWGIELLTLPNFLYQSNILAPLGLYSPSFTSADFFPILPNVFLFLFGVYSGRPIAYGAGADFLYKSHSPALALIGRNSLSVYLLHQPIIFLLGYIIFII